MDGLEVTIDMKELQHGRAAGLREARNILSRCLRSYTRPGDLIQSFQRAYDEINDLARDAERAARGDMRS